MIRIFFFIPFYETVKEVIFNICKVPPSNHRSKNIVPLNHGWHPETSKAGEGKILSGGLYMSATLSGAQLVF